MSDTCGSCGGTGDKWDSKSEDWATPLTDCPKCKGTGEVVEIA